MAVVPDQEHASILAMPEVEIVGLRLPLIDLRAAIELVTSRFGTEPVMLYFANAHTASLARKDASYHRVLNAADVLLNDGVGLAIAARLKGQRFPADLPGNVIVPQLLQAECMPKPVRVFLLGGQEEIVKRAGKEMLRRFDDVELVGAHHGYFAAEQEDDLVEQIVASEPHIVLVGMGNPKQELFIHRHRRRWGNCIVAGVGGLIDIWGGRIRDYPGWATRLRLHWLYRLCQEPRRLAYRYLVEVPQLWTAVLWSTPNGSGKKQDVLG